MTNPKTILRKARALISEPGTWTTDYLARDRRGHPAVVYHPEAVSFCALGAIYRASYVLTKCTSSSDSDSECAVRILHMAIRPAKNLSHSLVEFGVAGFNNSHTQGEVLAAFDKAINSIEEVAA